MLKKYILLILCVALGLMLADAPDSYALGTKPGTGKITWKHIIYFGHGWGEQVAASSTIPSQNSRHFDFVAIPLSGIRGGFLPTIWILRVSMEDNLSNKWLTSTHQKARSNEARKIRRNFTSSRNPRWHR